MDETKYCPDCDGPVDAEGDSTLKDNCIMPGWTHPDDCDTCGAVYCDRSC